MDTVHISEPHGSLHYVRQGKPHLYIRSGEWVAVTYAAFRRLRKHEKELHSKANAHIEKLNSSRELAAREAAAD